MTQPSPFASNLRRQLEITRFERAMEIVEGIADRRLLLTTAELARINSVLVGKDPAAHPPLPSGDETDPCWRDQSVTITLPSGRVETLTLITDPKLTAREHLHHATAVAEGGDPVEAAIQIYSGLVLAHVFNDANRRSAVLAAHYFFRRYGVPLSGLALHELGLGDLREPEQMETLRETVRQMAKFTQSKRKN